MGKLEDINRLHGIVDSLCLELKAIGPWSETSEGKRIKAFAEDAQKKADTLFKKLSQFDKLETALRDIIQWDEEKVDGVAPYVLPHELSQKAKEALAKTTRIK